LARVDEVHDLVPAFDDFNADLSALGPDEMLRRLLPQLDLSDRPPVAGSEAVGRAADAQRLRR
jgi:hypothetical protein